MTDEEAVQAVYEGIEKCLTRKEGASICLAILQSDIAHWQARSIRADDILAKFDLFVRTGLKAKKEVRKLASNGSIPLQLRHLIWSLSATQWRRDMIFFLKACTFDIVAKFGHDDVNLAKIMMRSMAKRKVKR